MSDHKDSQFADTMLYFIMHNSCIMCGHGKESCKRCRSLRYYKKLLPICKEIANFQNKVGDAKKENE